MRVANNQRIRIMSLINTSPDRGLSPGLCEGSPTLHVLICQAQQAVTQGLAL
jgi:hypothetical protein